MAAAAAPSFHSTRETTNYARLCRLLVDVGSDVLRETFEKKRPTGNLDTVLSSPSVHKVLLSLKKKVLNPQQWGKLYPPIKSSVSSRNFDITLLMVLLRNICGLVRPATGWDTLPPATDTTLEADIVRIKCYRNTVYGHASEASVDDPTFNQYWQDIQDALVRLGGAGYQSAICDVKKECMDPDFEEHYKELLKQWKVDECSIKERLDKIEGEFHDLKELMIKPEKKTGVEAASAYTNALKESIKKQTEFINVASPTSSNKVRTDDIFTSLLIQHGRKPVEDLDMERGEQLQQFSRGSGKPVEHSQEIFLSESDRNDDMNPKSVLVTGKAGIGKTLYCQNLIRDWADNKLFQPQSNRNVPDFKFAYLLTFRQLSLLRDELVTLREILNLSSVLDEHSNIDDSLSEYIVDHSENVLIILDGFDEYSKQNLIVSDSDYRYANSAKEKMPVATLCAKLIKGKILKDSVVMMTSRPDEYDQVKGKIPFDRYVEITGFSEEQVKKYIEKYFKENEVMKNAVMDHITKNDNLVSFAHIPVLCSLMCSYFEYILNESINTYALPVSMGDIYSEVINMFLRKHSRTKGAPSKKTLDKLSKFAAHLLRKEKYLFSIVDDMKRFSSEEVESLKASGLLHCSPPFRKSFSETTKYFCFTHLTLQEYLAARWFVKQREIPSYSENASGMVLQFMSGILSKQNDHAFMRKLLRGIIRRASFPFFVEPRITLKCLAEYHDKEFALNFVKKFYSKLFRFYTTIDFDGQDCNAISFLLDVISTLNAEEKADMNQLTFQQSHRPLGNRLNLFRRIVPCVEGTGERSQTSSHHSSRAPYELHLFDCHITQTGVRQIFKVLKNELCNVTSLSLCSCSMADECVVTIAESLPSTNVTYLFLYSNKITDAGVASLSQALQTAACQVTILDLSENQITDAGVASLCQALQTAACQVTRLNLSENQITDAGVASLCLALQTAACQVTNLDLGRNQITDAGVASLCQALQTAACQVTELGLSENQITDAGVASLCLALQTAACQVTTLYLSESQITDAGVASLCQALQTAACQVTTLYLGRNQITDTGVASLCQALQTAACRVTALNLSKNQITDAGVATLCQTLQKAQCPVETLSLYDNSRITSVGMRCLIKLRERQPNLYLL